MLSNVFPFHAAISPSKQLGGGWNESILSCCWWDSFQFPQVSNRFPGQEFWTKVRTKVRTTETHCIRGELIKRTIGFETAHFITMKKMSHVPNSALSINELPQ
jgi:hypothetical protein